jgi:type VI secretion system protein ImpJ
MSREYREVMWSEGMFLLPHHFQFADRNRDTRLRQATEHVAPYNWGFKHLEIDEPALENSLFRIRNCSILLEDGTQLSSPGNLDLDSRSLKEGSSDGSEYLDIYIAVSSWRPDTANVIIDSDKAGTNERRYRREETEVVDENLGDNLRIIQLKRYRGRILWGSEPSEGYEKIQAARVKLSPSGESVTLDPGFVPPVVDIRAWLPLRVLCEDVYSGLSMASTALVRDFSDRDFSELLGSPKGPEAVFKMLATNAPLAALGQLCKTPNVHPYWMYLELLRLAATLGIFSDHREPPDFPAYRHEQLGLCFQSLKGIIGGLLDLIGTRAFFQREFTLRNNRWEVDLTEKWLDGNKRLFIGVGGEEDALRLDRNVSKIKLSSPDDVVKVTQKRLQGVGIRRLRSVPTMLPERRGAHYFQMQTTGDFWRNIEMERVIAISGAEDLAYKFVLYVV